MSAAPDKTEWRWGCLACLDGGQADSQEHALSLERMHHVFACPFAPGLDPSERARRAAWRKVKRERYELGRHPESAITSGALVDPDGGRGGAIAPVAPYRGPHSPPPVPEPATHKIVDVELPGDPDGPDLFPGE